MQTISRHEDNSTTFAGGLSRGAGLDLYSIAGPALRLTRGRDDNVVPALSLSPVSSSYVVPELLL
jgi:hypothetical protein